MTEMELAYTWTLVWNLFGMESVGTLALLGLEIEVHNYSLRKMRVEGRERESKDSSDSDSDSSLTRPETPSPTTKRATTFSAVSPLPSQEVTNDDREIGQEQHGNKPGEGKECGTGKGKNGGAGEDGRVRETGLGVMRNLQTNLIILKMLKHQTTQPA